MILLALDVDGTLDATGFLSADRKPANPGPIPWRLVEALHYLTPPGVVRVLVASGSPDWPGTARTGIPVYDLPERADALRAAAKEHAWCTRLLYVGDEDLDRRAAEAAGWEFVGAAEFSKVVEVVAEVTGKAAQP